MTATAARAGTKRPGVALALLSAICFGGSGPFGKALINAGFSAPQAVWLRVAGAAAVLVPLVLVLRGRAAAGTIRRFPRQVVGYGVAGVAGCQALYFVAAARLPIGVAILLEFTGPVLVTVWIRYVRRRPVPRSATAGVAIALVGLACVVEVWSGLRLDPLGLLAGLGAAACQACYFLIVERLSGDADPLTLSAAGFVVGTILLTPLAAPWSAPWQLMPASVAVGDHSAPGWVLAGWLVLVSTVLAYLCGVAAVQRLSAPVAGGLAYTEAVAATAIAWITLGERLSPVQLAGGAVVLAGAFIAQRSVPGTTGDGVDSDSDTDSGTGTVIGAGAATTAVP